MQILGLSLFFFLSLQLCLAARAGILPNQKRVTELPHRPAAVNGAYVSAMRGNGKAYGGNTTGDTTMQWKALELRFGTEIDASAFGAVGLFSPGKMMRVDFVHYNEGHPDNNHRDGFAIQLVYSNALSNSLTGELGVGPYLSMNTTEIGGVQINDSNLGALLSLALRIGLDQYSEGLHLRIGLNHVAMRDVHSSNALLIGVGKRFGNVPAYPANDSSRNPVWIRVAAGNSVTNQAGTEGTLGYNLEAKQYRGQWAASIAAIFEGDDGARVDRRGVAVQGWFVQPLTGMWTVSAGAGPYVARNERGSGRHLLHGLITLQADRSISKDLRVFASFSRVKTFREKNDRDLFRIGVMKQFGR